MRRSNLKKFGLVLLPFALSYLGGCALIHKNYGLEETMELSYAAPGTPVSYRFAVEKISIKGAEFPDSELSTNCTGYFVFSGGPFFAIPLPIIPWPPGIIDYFFWRNIRAEFTLVASNSDLRELFEKDISAQLKVKDKVYTPISSAEGVSVFKPDLTCGEILDEQFFLVLSGTAGGREKVIESQALKVISVFDSLGGL